MEDQFVDAPEVRSILFQKVLDPPVHGSPVAQEFNREWTCMNGNRAPIHDGSPAGSFTCIPVHSRFSFSPKIQPGMDVHERK